MFGNGPAPPADGKGKGMLPSINAVETPKVRTFHENLLVEAV